MVAKFKRDRFTVITVRRNILSLLDRLKQQTEKGTESRCDVIERLATEQIKRDLPLGFTASCNLLSRIVMPAKTLVALKVTPKASFNLE